MIQRIPTHRSLFQKFKDWRAARHAKLQRAAWVNELDSLYAQTRYIRVRESELTHCIEAMDRGSK